jgi:hypothetical protein
MPENTGRAFEKLTLPLPDLIGMDIEQMRQLGRRLLALDPGQSQSCLEDRCVILTGALRHLISWSSANLAVVRQKIHLSTCPDSRRHLWLVKEAIASAVSVVSKPTSLSSLVEYAKELHHPMVIGMICFLTDIGSMLRPRWLPQRSFPPYSYLPWRGPHPVRDPTALEDMVERGRVDALWMAALRRLIELLGVAQQDDGLRRLWHGQHVRKGHLGSFVDKEHVVRVVRVRSCPKPSCGARNLAIVLKSGKASCVVSRKLQAWFVPE